MPFVPALEMGFCFFFQFFWRLVLSFTSYESLIWASVQEDYNLILGQSRMEVESARQDVSSFPLPLIVRVMVGRSFTDDDFSPPLFGFGSYSRYFSESSYRTLSYEESH